MYKKSTAERRRTIEPKRIREFFTINLIVGDWSGDGHTITENVTISSNCSVDSIRLAYKEGCKILGFDFSETVCREFEDRFVPEEIVEKLAEHGIKVKLDEVIDKYELDTKSYTSLYLQIAKLGNDGFNYYIVSGQTINIGGYGLYELD